jgi:hypothetical protein
MAAPFSQYHVIKKRQGLKKGQSRNAVCLAMLGRLNKPLKMARALQAEASKREAQEKLRAVG